MVLPLELLAHVLKVLFNDALRRLRKERQVEGCRNLVLSFQNEKGQRVTVNSQLTFVPGRWMIEPFSAIFRIENLPAKLENGEGIVDLVLEILPLKINPKISERQIEINAIYKFKGSKTEDFIQEFRRRFLQGWH